MKSKFLPLASATLLLSSCAGGNGSDQSLSPTYACDSAVLNITIADYDSLRNGYIEAITYTYDDLGEIIPTPLDPLGKVTMRFDLQGDMTLSLLNASADDRYGTIRIAPGEVTDATIYRDSIVTNGRFAEFNRQLSKYQNKYDMNIFSADFFRYDMNGDDYTAAIIAKYKEQKAAIDADTSLSDIQRVIENAELTNDLLTLASDRQFAGRCNYFTLNGYDKPLNFDSIAVDMSPANYAAVIAAIDPDDETILMSGHSSVASSLGNVDWNAAGAEGSLLGTLSTYRQAARLAYEGRPDSTLTDRLKAYDNPFFARAIDNIDAVAQKRFAEAARLVSPVPDVEDTEIINAIAAMHPGKVVLIDRWNTWCGPCKAGIAETEPLKADLLSDPDIVWVYIADESSPVPAYYKMIPSIKGHHYRLTESQSRAIYDRYGIDGIPYYFLIDRKGTVTPRPDFRDHDLLVSTILEELKK
ncbi:hypothetical protein EEL51_08185 [Muribaculaceae bacterium Isolate-110 (HZI)]|nr:hypothetical protein EEL51_08185 [Muribaculaceae bacterium Isolate-110 (HZI)]